ncbi:hypothetical protein MRX96_003177 [Rhipicephalus microplus]
MEGHEGNIQTNLIINCLPQDLTDEEFWGMFTRIGPIKSSKILRHKASGYSYGFGFVDYQRAGDAARAVESLNGFQLQNKKIKVAYARPSGQTTKHANLYIRGIPKHFPPEEVEKLFADFAPRSCDLLEVGGPHGQLIGPSSTGGGGPMCGAQDCYCYNPLTGFYQYPMEDMTFAPIAADGDGHVLFVYNIGTDTDETSLWQLFTQYGMVTSVNIIRDRAVGLSKNFGFVTMVNYLDCVRAIEALNGFYYAGRPLQVSLKQPN